MFWCVGAVVLSHLAATDSLKMGWNLPAKLVMPSSMMAKPPPSSAKICGCVGVFSGVPSKHYSKGIRVFHGGPYIHRDVVFGASSCHHKLVVCVEREAGGVVSGASMFIVCMQFLCVGVREWVDVQWTREYAACNTNKNATLISSLLKPPIVWFVSCVQVLMSKEVVLVQASEWALPRCFHNNKTSTTRPNLVKCSPLELCPNVAHTQRLTNVNSCIHHHHHHPPTMADASDGSDHPWNPRGRKKRSSLAQCVTLLPLYSGSLIV